MQVWFCLCQSKDPEHDPQASLICLCQISSSIWCPHPKYKQDCPSQLGDFYSSVTYSVRPSLDISANAPPAYLPPCPPYSSPLDSAPWYVSPSHMLYILFFILFIFCVASLKASSMKLGNFVHFGDWSLAPRIIPGKQKILNIFVKWMN